MQTATGWTKHVRFMCYATWLALALALLLTGCQGAQAPLPSAGERPPSAAAENPKLQDALKAARDQLWQKFLADPATSGVDYHADRITVSYLPAASLPRGFSFTPLPTAMQAAAQPNAMLRDYRECELFTDAIAGTYGLTISNQVYTCQTRLAGFRVPVGVDGAAVPSTPAATRVSCARGSCRSSTCAATPTWTTWWISWMSRPSIRG